MSSKVPKVKKSKKELQEEEDRIIEEENRRLREEMNKAPAVTKSTREKPINVLDRYQGLPDVANLPKSTKRPVYGKHKKTKPILTTPETPVETPETVPQEESSEDDWETAYDKETEKAKSIKEEPMETKEVKKEEPNGLIEPKKEIIKSPICCVLGNVDAGKTTFIDKIKSSSVAKGEVGGITQQIRTHFVPFKDNKFNIPGTILIDTPGHDSFYNMRAFGISMCNFVLLMVDVMEGVKEQTIKSIELIKTNKIPYVVVLNKVDRLQEWKTNISQPMEKSLLSQSINASSHFYEQTSNVITQFAENGLNVDLHFRNPDIKKYANVYPISSKTGEGIPELFMGIMKLLSNYLKKDIVWTPNFSGLLINTNNHNGFGKYLDILVHDGTINKKDTLVLTTNNGAMMTPINKLGEIDGKHFNLKESILATKQVQVVLKDVELTSLVIGSPVYVIPNNLSQKDKTQLELEVTQKIKAYLDEKKHELESYTTNHGVLLHASSYGSLTAVIEYLKANNIPCADANVGTIRKQDVMKCINFNGTKPKYDKYKIVLAFDVNLDGNALNEANGEVVVIQENIIYKLFERLQATIKERKNRLTTQYIKQISIPCVLEILPDHIYAKRNPVIVGIKVVEGELRKGCIINICRDAEDDPTNIGIITGIKNKKGIDQDVAMKNEEVSIQIDPKIGTTPVLMGRDFETTDKLLSNLTDNCSSIFRNHVMNEVSEDIKVAYKMLLRIYGL